MPYHQFRGIVRLGIKSLLLHKLRPALTMLGIIFGVCSVIAMLAIGEGASYEAQERIKNLGSNNIIVNSVKPPEEREQTTSGTSFELSYGLTFDDGGDWNAGYDVNPETGAREAETVPLFVPMIGIRGEF